MVESTANRTAKIDAGNFAVINTNGNLAVSLNNGKGVNVADAGDTHTVSNKANHLLTDASVDVTTSDYNVVIPDDSRSNVNRVVAMSSIDDTTTTGNNIREINGDNKILSVFKWDITFTVTFPSADSKDVGLFFDLSKSWAHTYNEYTGTATADKYYTDAACATAVTAGTTLSGSYYTKTPKIEDNYVPEVLYTDAEEAAAAGKEVGDVKTEASGTHGSTAYGFRMAFLPKTVAGTNDEAYAKVWSPFRDAEDNGGCKFIDATESMTSLPIAMPDGVDYSTATIKGKNATFTEATLTKGVLMDASETAGVPLNGAKNNDDTEGSALYDSINYLGFFKGGTVRDASITFTCVAWYEGTDLSISHDARVFETVATSLAFGVSDLNTPEE